MALTGFRSVSMHFEDPSQSWYFFINQRNGVIILLHYPYHREMLVHVGDAPGERFRAALLEASCQRRATKVCLESGRKQRQAHWDG